MKTFFAVLAIFICPTFAFGDTIGPSTGCANSACVGDTYRLNPIYYPGNQFAVDFVVGVANFSDRTGNSISGQEDQINSPALKSNLLITRMRLRHPDGGVHEWSANEKSFGYALRAESAESAGLRRPFLTTYKSSVWADEDEADLLASNMTDDFFRYAGSFARPTWFDDRKEKGDNDRNKNDNGKKGAGKNGKDGDNGHRGKHGGDDGEKGGGDDNGGKGGHEGGNGGGDDGHTRRIPEPSSLIMLGTGLLIGGTMLRKLVA